MAKVPKLPIAQNIPCYIINLTTGTTTEFFLPEELSDAVSANYDDYSIPGRAGTLKGYNNTSNRTLSFSVHLLDDYCPKGIVDTVNAFRALEYPHYSNMITAPSCFLRIGKIGHVGVITSVDVSWELPYRDGHYMNATLSISFEAQDVTPYSSDEVEVGL